MVFIYDYLIKIELLMTKSSLLSGQEIFEEQTKIAKFLSKVASVLEKEKEKLEELREWKKGLLQGMFV